MVEIGRLVTAAYERHARDLATCDERGLYFDDDAAQRVVDFFALLRHWKGDQAGQPFVLTPLEDFVVRSIFGWKRLDGTRRFRTAYLEWARKNGKTTFAAGIALYMLMADGEAGAEIYSAATKRDQAKIVWKDAAMMVRQSPQLARYCTVYDAIQGVCNISVPRVNGKFEPVGRDADTLDGLNPSCVIIDELHAHRSREVWDVLISGMGARRQPLMLAITTAGLYDPESIGWEQHERARQVLEGLIEDDSLFALIAAAEQTDDPFDERSWEKANPHIDDIISREYLRIEAETARSMPTALNAFLRYHLNIWTHQVNRWIPPAAWAKCGWMPANPDDLRDVRCWGGLDLASVEDLVAFVLVWPDGDMRDEGAKVDVKAWFWVPEETVRTRARQQRASYEAWVRDKWIRTTPGNVIDEETIIADLGRIASQYPGLVDVGFDRWGSKYITQTLANDHGITCVAHGQGFADMTAPSKRFERLTRDGRLAHGGNPVLAWMANNVAVDTDPSANLKPNKARSGEKIDGITALIMAIGRWDRHEQDGLLYDDDDLITVTL